jgi:hypothetical protein
MAVTFNGVPGFATPGAFVPGRPLTQPVTPPSLPPVIPTSGGTVNFTTRVLREIRPGDVPASGAQLPKLTGRAFTVPVPAEHVTQAWPEPPPEPAPAGPGLLELAAGARDQAAATAGQLVAAGRIFADPPYQRHRKTCGAIRKIGGVMLTCKLKPGHAGPHSDRGLDWR